MGEVVQFPGCRLTACPPQKDTPASWLEQLKRYEQMRDAEWAKRDATKEPA